MLKAAANFSGGETLVSGQDPLTGGAGELSFAVALKNLVLDTTSIPGGAWPPLGPRANKTRADAG